MTKAQKPHRTSPAQLLAKAVYKERQELVGNVQVQVWVPASRRDDLVAFAAQLRSEGPRQTKKIKRRRTALPPLKEDTA